MNKKRTALRKVLSVIMSVLLVAAIVPLMQLPAKAGTYSGFRYKTSVNGSWIYTDGDDPLATAIYSGSGLLWVDWTGSGNYEYDIGALHPAFGIGEGSVVVLTSSGGGTVKYWSGSTKKNLMVLSSGTIYVGKGVIIQKYGGYSAIACEDGTCNVYFEGTLTVSSSAGIWTDVTMNYHRLSTAYAPEGSGTINTYTYATIDLAAGSGVSGVTYPTGYLQDAYTYTGRRYYSSYLGTTASSYATYTIIATLADNCHFNGWTGSANYYSATQSIELTSNLSLTANGEAHSYTNIYTGSNGASFHSAYCSCGAFITEACSGGTATCTAAAKCAYCNTTYGATLGHNYVSSIVDPTCTERGYTLYQCSRCDSSYKSAYVNALGHSWDSGVSTATCTEAGIKTYTCTRCSATRTEAASATGHKVASDAAVAATCTQPGLTAGTHCTVCLAVLTAQEPVAAIGHLWNTGVITTPATCVDDGVKTFTCLRCSDTYTEPVYATAGGHTVVIDEAVAATCTQTGLTEGSHCSVCATVITAQTVVPVLGHLYVAEITPPTCTAGGFTTYTCSRCGDSYVEAPVTATGHSWNNGIITTPATCTSAGVKTYTCNNCSETYTESVPSTGHTSVPTERVEPTCTQNGVTAGEKCSVCGEILTAGTVIPALKHLLGDWTVLTAATCVTEGTEQRACTRCDYTESRAIAKLEHSFTGEVLSGNNGTHSYKCVNGCNEYSAPEACFDSAPVVTPPTCTADGFTTYTCEACSYQWVVTDEGSVTEHTWNNGEITTEPTCTESGEKTLTCTVCAVTKTEPVAATGHGYEAVVTAPACTEQGFTTYTCPFCGDSYKDDYTQATGHVWDAGEITTVATCTEDGVRTFTCLTCGETKTEAVAKTGHNYEAVVTPATCTEDGYTTYTCLLCNDSYMDDATQATGHSWNDGEITLAPTCKAQGNKAFTCLSCGEIRNESIAIVAHTPDGGTVTTQPTCTADGVVTYKCIVCGDVTGTASTPMIAHTLSDWITDIAPGCAAEGSRHKECTVCSAVIETAAIGKIAHTPSAWITQKAPTCTSNGTNAIVCTVCGATIESQSVAAYGHTDADGDNICDVCGADLDPTHNCSCICHATGFRGVIYKISRFFWKIFKIKQYCDCGQAHY